MVIGTEKLGVLVSDDNGKHFRASNDGFYHRQIVALALDPAQSGRILAVLANAPDPILATQDGGRTWSPLGPGLGTGNLRHVYASPDGWWASLGRGGLVHRMPLYAAAFMVFMLASIGLPGTSGFVGEFLSLLGVFKVNTWVAALGATGTILGAAYMLWLYRRVIFGELTKPDLMAILDLSPREVAVFVPLVAVVLWMGVYPVSFLSPMHATIAHVIGQYDAAVAAAGGAHPVLAALPQ